MEDNNNTGSGNSHVDNAKEAAECSVKERCWEQREALPGEPRCIICSRYGEYICDETEDDVCSKECKSALLAKVAKAQQPPANIRNTAKITAAADECFYVKDVLGSVHPRGQTIDRAEYLRSKINIRVKGDSVPSPILSFSACGLPGTLEKNLEAAGYDIPTPVQMQTIPAALVGRNLLVTADTGSGKTASFLVPLVSRCSSIRSQNPHTGGKRPLAIVLTPTRELCEQVEKQAKMVAKGLRFKTALVVGGDPMPQQVYRIENGVELIVATPGRLIDLLTKHHEIDLSEVSILVLDEVDCMLQRGFRDQVMQTFQALSQPQVLMFSATVSPEVEKMAACLLTKDLVHITAGRRPGKPNASVKQVAIWVESKRKKQKLFEILTSEQHFRPPAVVFVGSRAGADLLSEAITVATGLRALSIHGEKEMKERRESLRLFLAGEAPVMVSTGVLGRGVDLLTVQLVIVFDMPNSMEEYVHQVGRASRMGGDGTAIVFVNQDDKRLFRELVGNLKSAGAAIPRELSSTYCSSSFVHTESNRDKRRKYGL